MSTCAPSRTEAKRFEWAGMPMRSLRPGGGRVWGNLRRRAEGQPVRRGVNVSYDGLSHIQV